MDSVSTWYLALCGNRTPSLVLARLGERGLVLSPSLPPPSHGDHQGLLGAEGAEAGHVQADLSQVAGTRRLQDQ